MKFQSKVVYISGRITGLNESVYIPKFDLAKQEIEENGGKAISPLEVEGTGDDKSWEVNMRICIMAMMQCDALYVLNDWQTSRGAKMEVAIARKLKFEIIYQ